MGVDEAKRLVEALGAHDREHRPEYLLAVDAHLGRHLVEQRAADEEALLIALDVEPASVDHQLSAFGHACVDIALHLVAMFPRPDRAPLGLSTRARPDLDFRSERHPAGKTGASHL